MRMYDGSKPIVIRSGVKIAVRSSQTPPPPKPPKSARMEALLRLCLTLQSTSFMGLAAEPALRFSAIVSATRAGQSELHGRGLFAADNISPGSVVAFYAVHALGDAARRFESEGDGEFGGSGHKPYRVALPASPGNVAWGADDLWIDVAQTRDEHDGWRAHVVNDAATCASAADADILEYYARSMRTSNCRLVSFGDTPFVCYVATAPIAAGTELLGGYGHEHWVAKQTGDVPPYTQAVTEAEAAWREVSRSWRKRVMDDYAAEVAALAAIVAQSYAQADSGELGEQA
jgi:hypothetical protein